MAVDGVGVINAYAFFAVNATIMKMEWSILLQSTLPLLNGKMLLPHMGHGAMNDSR